MTDPVAEASAFLDSVVAASSNGSEHLTFTVFPWANKWRGGKWEKIPVKRKGFTFDDFEYGQVIQPDWTPDDGQPVQVGFACGPRYGLLVIDVDEPEEFRDYTQAGKLISRDDAMSTRGDHYHVGLDYRDVPADKWPKLGRIGKVVIGDDGKASILGADVKANGFVASPGSLHYSGTRYEPVYDADGYVHLLKPSAELVAAILADRNAPKSKSSDGKVISAYDHDTEQAGVVMRGVRAGLTDEQIRAEWDKTAAHDRADCDETGSMGDAEFERHLGSARRKDPLPPVNFPAPVLPAAQNGNSQARELIRPAGLEGVSDEYLASLPVNGAAPAQSALNLPAAFWGKLPVLGKIRQAAWSRGCPADSVLYAVLARTAAMCPPGLRGDAGCGPFALILFAALCGPSSAGKSTSQRVARELLPELAFYPGLSSMPGDSAPGPYGSHFADNLPLGSGEGIAECYMSTEEAKFTDANGKERIRMEKRKTKDHAFFYIDEGEALTKQGDRSGATIGNTLRSAWGGETIGQANASKDRWRIIPGGTYSLGIVAGFQPATIGPLLADANAGTPQRFVYANATDPLIPDEPKEWPGQLKLKFGTSPVPAVYPGPPVWNGGTSARWEHTIPFAEPIKAEIRRRRLARSRGTEVAALLDGHADLTRAKLATLLAVLEERAEVDAELWELSGVMWQTSCTVRTELLAYGAAEQNQREQWTRYNQAGRQLAVEDAIDERAMAKAFRAAGRHVVKQKCEGGCKPGCFTKAIDSKTRALVSIDEVIERLTVGEIVQADANGRYRPGRYAASLG